MYNRGGMKIYDANDFAIRCKPKRGKYLLTDVNGHQKKAEVIPADKSLGVDLVDAPLKGKNCSRLFVGKGRKRLSYDSIKFWNDTSFKAYVGGEDSPVYFEGV